MRAEKETERMSANLNTTTMIMNETQLPSCYNPTVAKKRNNLCLVPDISYFAGWEQRHRDNCLQDENHEKTHQLFYRKHVRFAVSYFVFDTSAYTNALYRLLDDRWSVWPRLI